MSRAAAFCVLLALLAGAPAGDAARGGRELLRPRGSEEGLRRELITEDNLFSHNSTKCRPDLVGRGNATFCDGVLVRWTALLASTQLEHRSSASAQRQRGEYPEGWPPTPPPAPSPPASTAPSTSPTTPSTTRSSPCRRRSHTGSTSPRARAAPTPSAGERRAVPSPPSEFPARTPTLADGPLSTLHKRRFQGLPTVGPRAPYNSGSLAPPGRVLARAPASFPHTHTHTPHPPTHRPDIRPRPSAPRLLSSAPRPPTSPPSARRSRSTTRGCSSRPLAFLLSPTPRARYIMRSASCARPPPTSTRPGHSPSLAVFRYFSAPRFHDVKRDDAEREMRLLMAVTPQVGTPGKDSHRMSFTTLRAGAPEPPLCIILRPSRCLSRHTALPATRRQNSVPTPRSPPARPSALPPPDTQRTPPTSTPSSWASSATSGRPGTAPRRATRSSRTSPRRF